MVLFLSFIEKTWNFVISNLAGILKGEVSIALVFVEWWGRPR